MDSLLALLLVFGVFAGIALGFVIGKSVTRSSTKADLIALQASVDAERATVMRLEAERARRVEEEKEELSIVTAMRDLKTKMGDLEKLTHDAEVKRVAGETSIKEQIEAMRTGNESLLRQTTKLTGALANPATRGKYGETQLEMLLKNAGLVEGVHYERQKERSGDDGIGKPDIRIKAPGENEFFIDSKFPLDRFWEALDEEDEAKRKEMMKDHAADLMKHVNALAKRDYQGAGQSPDFVVLFVPFESILTEALMSDPLLQNKAFEKNVSISTPNTMLALLRTVAYVFNRSKLAQSASEIQELAGELLKRIGKVHGKISTLGDRIKSTEKAFNELIASAEENMLRPARKIVAIGGLKVEKLKALDGVEDSVREIKMVATEDVDILELDAPEEEEGDEDER
jgi:DNA recombination protein RmuC